MEIRKATFRADELILVASSAAVPPLAFGERAQLHSGGPIGLVVDVDGDYLLVAFGDRECQFPRACLKRADR